MPTYLSSMMTPDNGCNVPNVMVYLLSYLIGCYLIVYIYGDTYYGTYLYLLYLKYLSRYYLSANHSILFLKSLCSTVLKELIR